MLPEGVRRLSLSGLDEDALRQLIEHGEDLFVERKRELPEAPKFGASAGAFANTLGGFLLLGVADDKEIVGWQPPGRADVQSHLAQVLVQQLDPLPPFVAETRKIDNKEVVVVRVFESADTPHIVRGTGAIYRRSAKGKDPVPLDDHQTLLQLARRGEAARVEAEARLGASPEVVRTFELDQRYLRRWTGAQFLAKAAPLTVTPQLSEWPLTESGANACLRAAEDLMIHRDQPGILGRRSDAVLRPFGRGIEARVVWERGDAADETVALADSAGVFAVAKREGTARGSYVGLIQAILKDHLRPLAAAMGDFLKAAEVVGPCAVDLTFMATAAVGVMAGGRRSDSSDPLHCAGTLISPASSADSEDLAQRWHREFQRDMGIVKYEPQG